eukprot:860001-Lingulodinium_polyedra.AAC.1
MPEEGGPEVEEVDEAVLFSTLKSLESAMVPLADQAPEFFEGFRATVFGGPALMRERGIPFDA